MWTKQNFVLLDFFGIKLVGFFCDLLPVVKVGAVGEIFAAQLAWFPHICQAGDKICLQRAVLTDLVKLLPCLSSPVGADLLAHDSVEKTSYTAAFGDANTCAPDVRSALGSSKTSRYLNPRLKNVTVSRPALWGIGFGAAVELSAVHLSCWGSLWVTFGRRVSATKKALPQWVLGEGLASALLNQPLHDLVFCVHGSQDPFTRHLAVCLLRPVTTV